MTGLCGEMLSEVGTEPSGSKVTHIRLNVGVICDVQRSWTSGSTGMGGCWANKEVLGSDHQRRPLKLTVSAQKAAQ